MKLVSIVIIIIGGWLLWWKQQQDQTCKQTNILMLGKVPGSLSTINNINDNNKTKRNLTTIKIRKERRGK